MSVNSEDEYWLKHYQDQIDKLKRQLADCGILVNELMEENNHYREILEEK